MPSELPQSLPSATSVMPSDETAAPAAGTHSPACICRQHPLPATMSVRAARDAYLAENGFALEDYDATWTPVMLLGLRLGVPNTQRHRWAIMLHDLHHVATGYGTDLTGEAEVSAWELQRGLRGLGPYVGSIVTMGAVFGVLYAPSRTLAARRVCPGEVSLFACGKRYAELLDLTVGELRGLLGMPRDGLATTPRRLHEGAPRERADAR